MPFYNTVILLVTVIAVLIGLSCGASQQADGDDTKVRGAKEGFTIVEIKKKDLKLVDEILKHRKKAIELSQKIFVQIVAEWCVPCKALRTNMGHELMGDAFQGTYIVQLDFDEWVHQLPDINVPNKKLPIPAFFRIDAKGVATNQTINGGAWEDDTPKNMAPVLKKYFLN